MDDCAEACLLLMERYSDEPIVNVGAEKDISIEELAKIVAEVVGYRGEIFGEKPRPDRIPRKLLNIERITALGWNPRIRLREGLTDTSYWSQKAGGIETVDPGISHSHSHG